MNFRQVLPIQIGAIALLVGGYLVYATIIDSDEDAAPTIKDAATKPLTSKKGGFSLGVPDDLKAKKSGRTVTLTSKDKSLVVKVGPVDDGSLKVSSAIFVKSLEQNYRDVLVLGTEKQKVDGRNALATFGQAVNPDDVRIRFVNVVVKARPRNFAINSFTAFDSDPLVVLPKVNAIVNSFTVRE